jgi:predicted CopG family antitoxin
MKNITVSDDVYREIASLKLEGDSFSDVLRRILDKKHVKVSSFSGVLRGSKFLDELEKEVKKNRKEMEFRDFQ